MNFVIPYISKIICGKIKTKLNGTELTNYLTNQITSTSNLNTGLNQSCFRKKETNEKIHANKLKRM